MNKTRIYELQPHDSHKSYYKKAMVIVIDNDNEYTRLLKSYDTIVCSMDACGNITRYWNDYSATTGRHIASFCGMNKASFTALPVKALPAEYAAYETTYWYDHTNPYNGYIAR